MSAATDWAALHAAEATMKTLPKRLREAHAPGDSRALMDEAAGCIELLERRIVQMRKDALDEQRAAYRDTRDAVADAVAEARWRSAQGEDYGSY